MKKDNNDKEDNWEVKEEDYDDWKEEDYYLKEEENYYSHVNKIFVEM